MKLKGIMAAAVTVAMVSSCIHIPMTTAQAQTLLSNMTAYAVQMNELRYQQLQRIFQSLRVTMGL